MVHKYLQLGGVRTPFARITGNETLLCFPPVWFWSPRSHLCLMRGLHHTLMWHLIAQNSNLRHIFVSGTLRSWQAAWGQTVRNQVHCVLLQTPSKYSDMSCPVVINDQLIWEKQYNNLISFQPRHLFPRVIQIDQSPKIQTLPSSSCHLAATATRHEVYHPGGIAQWTPTKWYWYVSYLTVKNSRSCQWSVRNGSSMENLDPNQPLANYQVI